MSSSLSAFKILGCLALKVVRQCSGIITCKNHTAAFALTLEPEEDWIGPALLLTDTRSLRAQDRLGSRECCSHFDHHLQEIVALKLEISSEGDNSHKTSELISTEPLLESVKVEHQYELQ